MRYNFRKIYKDGTETVKQLNSRNQLFFEISKMQYGATTYTPFKIVITTKAGKDITNKIFDAYLEN